MRVSKRVGLSLLANGFLASGEVRHCADWEFRNAAQDMITIPRPRSDFETRTGGRRRARNAARSLRNVLRTR